MSEDAPASDIVRRLAMLGAALGVRLAGGTVAYELVEDRGPSARSPPPTRCSRQGDVVMAIGTTRTLERLEELFTGSQPAPR